MSTNPNPNPNPNSSVSQVSMDELEKVFTRFDKNGDGKISATELGGVLQALGSESSEEEIKHMMKEIDLDGDGYIDLKEFSEFYNDVSNSDANGDAGIKSIKDAFEMYDKDKNGLISAKELHMVLKSLGEKCSLQDCFRMISNVDSDGDGNVNFAEFKKMMTNGST